METGIVLALQYGIKYGPDAFKLVKSLLTTEMSKEELLKALDALEDILVAGEVLIPKRPG